MAIENEHRDWRLDDWGEYCPTKIDWARMAAYIDGEGSICINTRKYPTGPSFHLLVMVANTDVRLMVWMQRRFGGKYRQANAPEYYETHNAKESWHWSISANRAAWILYHCLPYFVIKTEQAELGLSLQKSMNRNAGKPGLGLMRTEVREYRKSLKRKLLIMKARGKDISPDQAKRIEEVS